MENVDCSKGLDPLIDQIYILHDATSDMCTQGMWLLPSIEFFNQPLMIRKSIVSFSCSNDFSENRSRCNLFCVRRHVQEGVTMEVLRCAWSWVPVCEDQDHRYHVPTWSWHVNWFWTPWVAEGKLDDRSCAIKKSSLHRIQWRNSIYATNMIQKLIIV